MAADQYLVTGGAGFIGSNLVDRLLRGGARVRVLDDLSTGHRANLEHVAGDVELVEADVCDEDAVSRAVQGCRYVVHLAAQVSVPLSLEDPARTHAVNATGTLNVLQAARQAGAERVVYASTCALYGEEPTLPKHERMLPDSLSPYAASKLAGEAYGNVYSTAFGVPVVSLRFFNVYGPRQDPSGAYASVIPKFITRWLAGTTPTVFGDGSQTRDFIYVDSVVDVLTASCTTGAAGGLVLNVGTGVETSVNDLIAVLSDIFGRELPVETGPARPGEVYRSVGDISRTRATLALPEAVSLRDGLARTVEYYRG